MVERGLTWYELQELYANKLRTPLSVAYAEVATHNHFVLDRGGKVFKQTAPIIKLPEGTVEDDHLALLAYLNSSTACFWMKQVAYPKGTPSRDIDVEGGCPENNRYAFSSTALGGLPVLPRSAVMVSYARRLEALQQLRDKRTPDEVFRKAIESDLPDVRTGLRDAAAADERLLDEMVAVQEDLDWTVYQIIGLVDGSLTGRWSEALRLNKDARPFAADTPPTDLVQADRELWTRRREALLKNRNLRLLEDPMFKRRWWGARGIFGSKVATYEERAVDAARDYLGDRLEAALSAATAPRTGRELGLNLAEATPCERAIAFVRDAGGRADPLGEVLARESVPFLAAHRYTDAGLEKRALWEETWALQRREDLGEKVGEIPVPPKYDQKDFRDGNFYRLRGKLDVPKERFISYPGCESDEDGEPIFGWAGWDHLQRAAALVDLYYKRKDGEGWAAERLVPILAGLLELLPWLKQWHNAPDADGARMGDEYEAVLDEEVRQLGLTRDKLREWRPVAGRVGRGRKAAADARTEAASGAPETEAPEAAAEVEAEAVAAPKRRGRPPKVAAGEVVTTETVGAAPKRRGRPPKVAEAEALATEARPKNGGLSSAPAETGDVPTAKRRGRPPKSAVGQAPPLAPAASTPPLARGETAPESVPAREASSGPALGPARGPTREAAAPPVPAPTPAEPVPKTKRGRPRKGSEGSLDLFGGDSDP